MKKLYELANIENINKLLLIPICKESETLSKIELNELTNYIMYSYVIIEENDNIISLMNQENAIYEIRCNIDLNGNELHVPENCILKFTNNSCISNGFLYSDKHITKIIKDINIYDYSDVLLCNIDTNFIGINECPINPYSKLCQKVDLKLTANCAHYLSSSSIELSDFLINYYKTCGVHGITVCVAIHWDNENDEPYADINENVYTYYKEKDLKIETIKFHIDGGNWVNKNDINAFTKYCGILKNTINNFVINGNYFNNVFIINEWKETLYNEDLIPLTLELNDYIHSLGYKTGIAINSTDISNDILNSSIDYKCFNIYPPVSFYDEYSTEDNTDIYTPFENAIKQYENKLNIKMEGISESGCSDTYITLRSPAVNDYNNWWDPNRTNYYEEYSPLINMYNKGLLKTVINQKIKYLSLWYSNLMYKGKVEELIKKYIY